MCCTCPLDAFNGTAMGTDPLPLWLPPERAGSLGSSTPVDRWLINGTEGQYEWTSRSGSSSTTSTKLFWLHPVGAERPTSSSLKVEKSDRDGGSIAVAARPIVGAMLTVILAWLVIRNLIGWHRNLPTDGQSGGIVTARGLRRHNRRRWRDDVDWIDYDADDSDSFETTTTTSTLAAATVEDDADRLLIGVVDASRPLGLSPPTEPSRCAVTYAGEEVEDDASMLYDLTSLSSDGWSSSGAAESLAVTGQEPPLHPTLLVCSPLAACYLGKSDESSSTGSDEEDEDEADVFESLSSVFVTPSSSMSTSFDDVLSDWEFDTASSGSRR